MDEAEFKKAIRERLRRRRAAPKAFVAAAVAGDLAAFKQAYRDVSETFTYREALRAVARVGAISSCLRERFAELYPHFGDDLRREVDDDLILIRGLRVLLPAYDGAPVQLYRGDAWANRKHRRYGLSWSPSRKVAEGFAAGWFQRTCAGGSVLLGSFVPAEAVICDIGRLNNDYNEDEYLVDRRYLGRVDVLARFGQVAADQPEQGDIE